MQLKMRHSKYIFPNFGQVFDNHYYVAAAQAAIED